MSLRFQITLRVLFFAILIIILGGSMAIWQARKAVHQEVDSSIHLALRLIHAGFADQLVVDIKSADWIHRLDTLQTIRHLTIHLQTPSGKQLDVVGKQSPPNKKQPPTWFVRLVNSDYPETVYPVTTQSGHPLILVIRANSLDEITEVWQETITFFMMLCLMVLLTFLAVHLVLNKSFQAIDRIVTTLKCIEQGQYQHTLPHFSTAEYNTIARAVNHLIEVLEETRLQNRALTQHSLQIQEEERQFLAQELHDELGQSLTAIKVMAISAGYKNVDTAKINRDISQLCDHLMQVVRSMMRQLHPLMLPELGLKATLEDMVAQWQVRCPGLAICLHCDDAVDKFSKLISIQLFRVIQECLTNINRHAQADEVSIILQASEERVNLRIKDNGVGGDLSKLTSGFGLLGVQERIKSLGGVVDLYSTVEQGFVVEVLIPI